MGLCPLTHCFCWKIKAATIAVCVQIVVTGLMGALFEILDIAALKDDNFEITGGFQSAWRAHVWEGWLACNIVMLLCNLLMVGYSILMIFAIKRFPTFYELNLTKGYMASLIVYILIELGINCYRYSWYGPNIFRLGYLVFTFIFWIVRTISNIFSLLIIYSRISELRYEIKYGEKRDLSLGGGGGSNTPYIKSNLETPLMSGSATPISNYPPPQSVN